MMRLFVKIGLILLLPTQAALAAEPGQSYLELDWLNAEFDGSGEAGFAIRGAVGFGARTQVFVDYRRVDDPDYENLRLGLGQSWPLSADVDLFGRVAYERQDVVATSQFINTGIGGATQITRSPIHFDGPSIELGLLARYGESFEASVAFRHVELDDLDAQFLILNGLYRWSSRWGLQLTLEVDEQTNILIGPRLSF